jgi:hypothetical protein
VAAKRHKEPTAKQRAQMLARAKYPTGGGESAVAKPLKVVTPTPTPAVTPAPTVAAPPAAETATPVG